MIKVTLLNGQELIINAELLEAIEQAHDTIITLTTGRKVIVKESREDVVEKVIAYRQMVSSISHIMRS
jgi:flagellar protein FlbD